MPSRWADSADDLAADAKKRAEKEEKKRLKAQRIAQQEEEAARELEERPSKRRRVSETQALQPNVPHVTWSPCKSVLRFELLNAIEEGSYGFVSRARDRSTGEIVALKKLKMDPIRDGGFPVTALREIQCLQTSKHRHVVDLREIVIDQEQEKLDAYLVMEFLEHDLKSLQEDMADAFTMSEVKTLMLQLTSAVEFLHDNWILHRDLKTSNILMNNRGEVKIADFGMARVCGDPPPQNLTQLVVTLWYRAPELLLGAKTYGAAIDIWSIGCIFGELLTRTPLLQGKNELDQLSKIADLRGIPGRDEWPDMRRLPNAKHMRLETRESQLRTRFLNLTDAGIALLSGMLSMNPERRSTAGDVLQHEFFLEKPRPKPTSLFPTFPSKAGQQKRRRTYSPSAPFRSEASRQ